jgi:hypothetical protein
MGQDGGSLRRHHRTVCVAKDALGVGAERLLRSSKRAGRGLAEGESFEREGRAIVLERQARLQRALVAKTDLFVEQCYRTTSPAAA